jgi:hypothetical protein
MICKYEIRKEKESGGGEEGKSSEAFYGAFNDEPSSFMASSTTPNPVS